MHMLKKGQLVIADGVGGLTPAEQFYTLAVLSSHRAGIPHLQATLVTGPFGVKWSVCQHRQPGWRGALHRDPIADRPRGQPEMHTAVDRLAGFLGIMIVGVRGLIDGVCMTRVWHTTRARDKPLNKLARPADELS